MEGYVKLWRKIDENPIFKKPTYLSVFLWILLHVNFKANQFIWNNEKITVRRGELLTSADKIAQGTAIPRGTVERILKYLKNEEMIEEQTTKKFRLILVKNYEQYQSNEEQNEEQLRNKRGTTEEQVDTIKNVNNGKNEKKVSVGHFVPPTLQEVTFFCSERNNGIDPEAFIAHYESNDWKVGRNKMKNWQAAVITWEKRNGKSSKKLNADLYE